MSRTAARFRQADIARSIRAAQQAGAGSIELRPDGTIRIILVTPPLEAPPISVEPDVEIVL